MYQLPIADAAQCIVSIECFDLPVLSDQGLLLQEQPQNAMTVFSRWQAQSSKIYMLAQALATHFASNNRIYELMFAEDSKECSTLMVA